MYTIYNKSNFGVDIDKTHIAPKETKKINKILDLDHLKYLELRGAISVYNFEEEVSKSISKSNDKKTPKKSNNDTINYINEVKESNTSTLIDDNKINENLGDEE